MHSASVPMAAAGSMQRRTGSQFSGTMAQLPLRQQQRRRRGQRLGVVPVEARRSRPDPIVAPVVSLGDDYCDMYSYLLRNRIIFVQGRILDQTATQVVAQLLALEAIDEKEEIKLYINSAGGSSYAVLAIVDAMAQLKCPISTVAFGMCGSVVSLILAAGTKGRRYSMPSSRIMMRQAMGGAMGSSFEVTITATELNHTNQVINKFYERFTGLSLERVEEETDRENYLAPAQAQELGLIDGVL